MRARDGVRGMARDEASFAGVAHGGIRVREGSDGGRPRSASDRDALPGCVGDESSRGDPETTTRWSSLPSLQDNLAAAEPGGHAPRPSIPPTRMNAASCRFADGRVMGKGSARRPRASPRDLIRSGYSRRERSRGGRRARSVTFPSATLRENADPGDDAPSARDNPGSFPGGRDAEAKSARHVFRDAISTCYVVFRMTIWPISCRDRARIPVSLRGECRPKMRRAWSRSWNEQVRAPFRTRREGTHLTRNHSGPSAGWASVPLRAGAPSSACSSGDGSPIRFEWARSHRAHRPSRAPWPGRPARAARACRNT